MTLLRLNALLSMLLIWGSAAFAQTSNAIIFTENGEKFTVILNGLRQNEPLERGLGASFRARKSRASIFGVPTTEFTEAHGSTLDSPLVRV